MSATMTQKVDARKGVWATPQYMFAMLDTEFHFDLDACATADNAKCENFISPEQDALAMRDWPGERIFMNPPYGRAIYTWVDKARSEAAKGKIVVCLLPARTDTKWFHGFILGKAEIRFLPGRVKFSGMPGPGKFPSMIVIFRKQQAAARQAGRE